MHQIHTIISRSIRKGLIEELRTHLEEGEFIIWREPFRWHRDQGGEEGAVISNAYEGHSIDQVAEDSGWEVTLDLGAMGVVQRNES